jgi:hypothetical protein
MNLRNEMLDGMGTGKPEEFRKKKIAGRGC